MNILLWIFQGLLAFYNVTGGMYTISNHEQLKSGWASDLPKAAWIAISAVQILFAIGLLIPKVTPIAAIYLAVNSLVGCVLFAKYAGFPGILWGVIPSLLALFIAYGRLVLLP